MKPPSARPTTKTKVVKPIAMNRKAFHEYFIEDRTEAGLALTGTEVKSLREGRAQLHVALPLETEADIHWHVLNRQSIRSTFTRPGSEQAELKFGGFRHLAAVPGRIEDDLHPGVGDAGHRPHLLLHVGRQLLGGWAVG